MDKATRRIGRMGFAVAAMLLATGSAWAQASGPLGLAEDQRSAVWSAARSGEEAALLELLSDLSPEPGAATDGFGRSIAAFENNVEARESDRAEQRAEVSTELDEHISSYHQDGDVLELSDALTKTIELQLLSRNEDTFFGDPRIAKVLELSTAAAKKAEEAGDWLIANELFFKLDTLFDKERKYRADAERLSRRLVMIRLYNPEQLWALRNARRVAAGESELPPYNGFGDDFRTKLEGITSSMIMSGLSRSAAYHVERHTANKADGVSMAKMLDGGLTALETMVTTRDLWEVFPGLKSESGRARFLVTLDTLKAQADVANSLSPRAEMRSLQETLRVLRRINAEQSLMPEEALLHEFGNGAMAALDDYTAIIWPDELARFQRSTQANFIGVGIQIQLDELMNIKVVTPLEGTPAQRAGIRSGDIIKKVDGVSAVGLSLDQAVEVITGPPNTSVTLTVERPAEDDEDEPMMLDFVLKRKQIDLPTVKGWEKTGPGDADWNYYIDEASKIGYVRLTGFAETTTDDFDAAIAELRRNGLEGLILDLRYNPGGLLDQAVRISNRFTDDGLIVRTEDANGRDTDPPHFARRLPASRDLSDLPVVVLINEGSASASEIVSGAIQAAARRGDVQALVVGQRSFGKGSVQQVFRLGAGMMKLTTQYYRIDSPRLIHRVPGATEWGIEPDLKVEMLPEQEQAAIMLRRSSDVLPLDEDGNVIEDAERPDPDTLLTDGIDLQVQAALVILQSQVEGEELHASRESSGEKGDL